MRYLRQNTATIVTVGPFIDVAGLVLETALTITNERISFTVDLNNGSAPTLVLDNVTGATSGTSNDLNYITNCDAGLMQLELAAANVNYLGRAFLVITDAANHCPVFHEFTILPAMVYDSLIAGTDVLQADMTQILGTAVSTPATAGLLDVNAIQLSGDATAANNAEAFFDGTGYAGTNNVIPTVTTVGSVTGAVGSVTGAVGSVTGAVGSVTGNVGGSVASVAANGITATSIAADAINAAAVKADAVTKIQNGLATPTNITAGTITTATNVTTVNGIGANVITAASIAAGAIDNATFAADVGSTAYATNIIALAADKAIANAALATAANLATLAGYVDTEVAAILADTNELQTDWVNGGRLDLILDIIAADTTTDIPALIADVPTVAEFEARTLPAADYVVVGDTLAAVTTVGTTTNLTNLPAAAALEASLNEIKGAGWVSDYSVTSIWTNTDNLLGSIGPILDRLGAWTGTGVNTVLGAFKALLSKDASAPSDIGGTFDPATDSLEALRDRGDAAWITATGFATPTNITAGTITTVTNLTNAPTNGDLTATMKTSVTTAATAATPTAAAVTGAVGSVTGAVGSVTGAVGSVTGNVGGNVVGSVGSVSGDTKQTADVATLIATVGVAGAGLTALATQASVNTIDDFLDTEVAAILADTNELQTDLVNGGRLDLLIDAIKAKSDNLPTDPADQSAVEAAITAATSPLATAAALATVAGYVDTEVAAILAAVDTEVAALIATVGVAGAGLTALATQASVNDIPTNAELAIALAGADDAVLTAIADVPTVAEFEARTLVAADYTVVSDLPSVAALALETTAQAILLDTGTTLDTLIKDVPTNAELATALGTADDATLAAIAALNNLSSAQAQTAATAALNAYDPPTNAEMVARTLVAADYATAAALTAVDDYVDAEVAAIKAVTDKLDTTLVLDGAVYDFTAAALAAAPTGGSAPSAADIRTEIDANSTKLASILEDTGTTLDALIKDIPTNAELEARTLVAAGYATAAALATVDDFVDSEVGAIKAVTDKIDTALVLDGAVYQLTANALRACAYGRHCANGWRCG